MGFSAEMRSAKGRDSPWESRRRREERRARVSGVGGVSSTVRVLERVLVLGVASLERERLEEVEVRGAGSGGGAPACDGCAADGVVLASDSAGAVEGAESKGVTASRVSLAGMVGSIVVAIAVVVCLCESDDQRGSMLSTRTRTRRNRDMVWA